MQRERVADNIWVFSSSLFAQVTAGVVFTSEGAVVIDTLPLRPGTAGPSPRPQR